MTDPNADLVGYEFEKRDGTRWRVTGTDPVLGANYVRTYRVFNNGELARAPHGLHVRGAESIRRRQQLEAA